MNLYGAQPQTLFAESAHVGLLNFVDQSRLGAFCELLRIVVVCTNSIKDKRLPVIIREKKEVIFE